MLNKSRNEIKSVGDVSEPVIRRLDIPVRTSKFDKQTGKGMSNDKVGMRDNRNSVIMNNAEIKQLFDKHDNVFKERPTVTHLYQHKLCVTDEKQFVRKTYPIPLHYQDRVDAEIQRMLE